MNTKLLLVCLACCIAVKGKSQHIITDSFSLVAADSQYTRHHKIHAWLLGSNYREVWATPVKTSWFTLQSATHHFKAVRTGGGLQTRSLHLVDKDGTEWVLRSVKKNPASWLKPFWRKTFIRQIVNDQVSGSHPYAALVVPVLAHALGIDHNNPQLVVIHDDTALGSFRSEFANRLCFLEERNPKGKTISTEKLFSLRDSLPGILVDSIAFLKCRLLDIVIGDWDRHADQYRWYNASGDGGKFYYKPIPNDRDQVFFNTGGLIPSLVRALGFMKYLEGFNPHVKSVKGFMQRGHHTDKKILLSLDYIEWEKIAREVKGKLTDQLLEEALSHLPPETLNINPRLLQTMKTRRDELPELVRRYYQSLQ